jgi:hypothetical protein
MFLQQKEYHPEGQRQDKSIIMFFKKGLTNLSLSWKLIMKNPRTCEEMMAIANYTLAEEVVGDMGQRPNKVSSDLTTCIGLRLYELINSLLSQAMFSQGNEAHTRDEGHGGPKAMERCGH